MQSQQQPLTRPDSPLDNNQQNMLHHLHSSDSLYAMHAPQNGMYPLANGNNVLHYTQDHAAADLEASKQQGQHHGKVNGFNFRNSFNAFPNTNATRPRHQTNSSILGSTNSYRDSSGFYPSSSEVFQSMTSPVQSQMHPYEGRPSLDLNNGHANHKHQYFADAFSPSGLTQQHQVGKPLAPPQQAQHNPYSTQTAPFVNGVHITSQTPYGPHVPSNTSGAPSNGLNTNGAAIPPSLAANVNLSSGSTNPATAEEISTIFVVGFPEDMQACEREFQNMFTFCPGFEAATLKIPNKEYTAYGSLVGANPPPGLRTAGQGYQPYTGPNDPYNLVTVNQGGVVVDGGRDGTMTSWPAAAVPGDDGVNAHFLGAAGAGAASMPPRKQIIGFAKFRTREEALMARDVLQGRRVDIEKGAVLKAEMAKKNLHTKRGVGPVPGNPIANATAVASTLNPTSFQQPMLNGHSSADLYSLNGADSITARDRQQATLEAMGLGNRLTQWREQMQQEAVHSQFNGLTREEEDRRAGIINAMGLGAAGARGARERAEEEERERRRKEKEIRLRSGTLSAYEAFHSVPAQNSPAISRQPSKNDPLFSPDTTITLHSNPLPNNGLGSQGLSRQHEELLVGPWDHIGQAASTSRPFPNSHSSTPPPPSSNTDTTRSFSPPPESNHDNHSHHAHSESSASSVTGSQNGGSDIELAHSLGALAVSTMGGKTSPQLPSPASGASSGSAGTRNGIDQNPPINTLYVGNLPTSPPPAGFPQDYLEESLRELFCTRPGFRRLCFRQKNIGPMCFVEFEDVHYATKALNDLYGNTLNGLIKGGGIRLSYSKNPLGVRTPTSAGGINGPSMQQQQFQLATNPAAQQGSAQLSLHAEAFKSRQQLVEEQSPTTLRHDPPLSPPPSMQTFNNFMISPPPRFFSASPSANSFGLGSSSTPLTGAAASFLPRNLNMYNMGPASSNGSGGGNASLASFGLSSSAHPSIPDQSTEDHLHYIHRTISPPGTNLEATRAG
ncbi:hypothetical protein BDN72DRAFT_855827 [Pluteus cervinus]|uniref:Uncharacterized protein n=1 Tax=Pluteus cervinus TaxID=181527 RepID=A0ACD3B2D1_9AGAR|nr:hypothetical protein BDN72DRAFT_855827 [Pluteus cervinus]